MEAQDLAFRTSVVRLNIPAATMRGSIGWASTRAVLERYPHRNVRQQCLLPRRQLHTRSPARPALPRSTLSHLQLRQVSVQTKRDVKSTGTRTKNLIFGSSITLLLTFTYLYVTDTRASIHEWLIVPTVRLLYPDAEDAHKAGNKTLKALYTFGLHPRERGDPDVNGDLRVEVFGHVLDNPIGTSAGIDKNAEIPDPLLYLGPGLVEVGGATPRPQEGNAKPRVWRIPSQNALINRYGLNSEGADNIAMRLRQRVRQFAYNIGLGLGPDGEKMVLDGEAGVPPGSLTPGRLLAVQVAKMKTTPDQDIQAVAQDYVYCVEKLAKYADVLVVNVSSPNTPGLRTLQQAAPLTAILTSVVGAAQAADRKTKPAVMVKVSPDEDSEDQVRGICGAIWASGVDGVIVGNTTNKRPDPLPVGYLLPADEEQLLLQQGGYSGPQMFERTLALVKRYRQILDQGPLESPPKAEQPKKKEPKNEDPKKEDAKSGESKQEPSSTPNLTPERIDKSVQRDEQRLKPLTPQADAESEQPLLRIPDRHFTASSEGLQSPAPALSSSTHAAQGTKAKSSATASSAVNKVAPHKEKVIFATGGITNGKQALEVLNAGASIAMVYTALVYGGAGTISRIKTEMRDEIKKQ